MPPQAEASVHTHHEEVATPQDDASVNHPLSCMDNACEAMISLFGAGSDHQDEEMEAVFQNPFLSLQEPVDERSVEETKDCEPAQVAPSEEPQVPVTPAPVTPAKTQEQVSRPQAEKEEVTLPEQAKEEEQAPVAAPMPPIKTKRTFSLSGKKNKKTQKTPVTLDDGQVEARRKSRLGRWWKKKFHKEQIRAKSAPRARELETVPPSPSTVASHMQTDYVDMTHEYSGSAPPTFPSRPSAASFTPRKHVKFDDSGSDASSVEEEEEINVWKELNEMWEESGHDMVRVISDNLNLTDPEGEEEEEDLLIKKYEQVVAAEQGQTIDVAV